MKTGDYEKQDGGSILAPSVIQSLRMFRMQTVTERAAYFGKRTEMPKLKVVFPTGQTGRNRAMEKESKEQANKEELWRTVKFTLFSISAGAIQLIVSGLLTHFTKLCVATCYFIALVCSVIWNFTFNRKYTFQSANNVPMAMLKVLGYYAVFTPLSLLLVAYLSDGTIFEKMMISGHRNWNGMLVIILNMLINFVTEYLFDRLVVFRDSIDTNDVAERKKKDKAARTSR